MTHYFFPADGTALTNTGQRGTASAPDGYVAYQYAVLRFLPRVEREEFVNVGVVLYSQSAEVLEVVWQVDAARITALFEEADVRALEAQLVTLRQIARGVGGGGRPTLATLLTRFGWIAAPRSTALQPGPTHGGITHDVAGEAERLLDRVVR